MSLPETSRPLVAEIEQLRGELTGRGLDHVVLCGMGGSSLAPEVICATARVELTVLDSSDPDTVRAALGDRLERTVVVVSSKSGGTVETDSQRRAYEQAFRDAGHDPADHLVIVTDPGSPLQQEATEAGYRVFTADPDVGGRYSALTAFGLVPSGLAGADIGRLLDEASVIGEALAEDDVDNPGLRLGALLGVANRAGADKVVLADAETPIVGFGDWVEQLIAESTGKDGKGILPVVVESPAAPNFDPNSPDEVLVSIGSGFPFDDVRPASGWGVSVDASLGAQVLLWEHAVAVAGQLIGINPFDQPDVESAKAAARGLLGGGGAAPEPLFTDGAVQVHATDGLLPDGTSTGGRSGRDPARPPRPGQRLPGGDGLPRPAHRQRARRGPGAARAAHRPADHVRLGPALPALHRAVPQGRPAARRLPAGDRRPGRGPAGARPGLHLRRVPRGAGGRRRPGAGRPRPTGAAPAPHRPHGRGGAGQPDPAVSRR